MFRTTSRNLFDYVFGYDFFISYTWTDGGAYAKELHQKLLDQGFTVFLDRQEFTAGDDWSFMARRAIRKTRKLIVVATPEIHQSSPVKEEVSTFAKTGRRIIAIELDDGLSPSRTASSPLTALVDPHLLVIRDDNASEVPSNPSRNTVNRLLKDFTQLRQTERRMRFLTVTSLVLILLLVAALVLAVESIKQRNAAKAASERAIASSKSANLNLAAAQWQRGNSVRGRPYGTDEPEPILGSWHLLQAASALEQAGETPRVHNALLASSFANANLISTALQSGVDNFVEDQSGNRILSWGTDGIRLWDAKSLSPLAPPIVTARITEAQFTPDERGIVSISDDETIALWDIASGERITKSKSSKVGAAPLPPSNEEVEADLILRSGFQALFSSDRNHLTTIGEDGTVTIWKTSPLEQVGEPIENAQEPIVRFNDEGSLLLILTEKNLSIVSTRTGQPAFSPLDLNGKGNSALFRPAHKEILIAAGEHFQIADSESGNLKENLDLKSPVKEISTSLDGSLIFLRTGDKRLIIDGSDSTELNAIPETPLELSEFSPDGSTLACFSNPGNTAHFWDTKSGEIISQAALNVSSSPLWGGNSIARFNKDGTEILANTMETSAVGRWDTLNGEFIGIPMVHLGTISHFWYLKNGNILTSSSESGDLKLWSKFPGAGCQLNQEGQIDQLEFSPDGSRLLSRTKSSVNLWDVHNQREIPSDLSQIKDSSGALFNTNSSRILLRSSRELSLWNSSNGKLIQGSIPSVSVTNLQFLPDGESFVSFDKKTIQLRNSNTGAILSEGNILGCNNPTLRYDGRYLWGCYNEKGEGILWTIEHNTLKLAATLPADSLSSTAFSSDGKFLALSSSDGLYIWDLAKASLQQLNKESDNTGKLIFSPDSKQLLEYHYESTSRLWEISSGKCLRETQDGPSKVFFTPDSSLILGNGGKEIFIWRTKDGTDAAQPLACSSIHDIQLNPGSGQPTVPLNKTLFVFDTKNYKWIRRLQADQDITSLSFSPDGKIAVTSGKGKASYQCWNFHSGKILFPELKHQSFVDAAIFNPAGTIIITNAQDKTIRLWDSVNGGLLACLPQNDDLPAAKLSSDGKYLATYGDKDGGLSLWNLASHYSRTAIKDRWLELEARSATTPSSDGKIRMLDADELATKKKVLETSR